MAERFPCEKCAGTGEVRWGRCHACKGRGSFASSPEKRAKRKLQRLDSRKAEAMSPMPFGCEGFDAEDGQIFADGKEI